MTEATSFVSAGNPELLAIERSVTVVGNEPVVTASGTYDALRLSIEQRTRYGQRTSSRQVNEWLVRGVGLVRYEEQAGGQTALGLELTSTGSN